MPKPALVAMDLMMIALQEHPKNKVEVGDMLDRMERGFAAGCVGALVKSITNAILHRRGMTTLRTPAIGADLVLGKQMQQKRQGMAQYLLGELANLAIGGGYGSLWAMATDSRRGRSTWLVRGLQLGTLAFTANMTAGTWAVPSTVQGSSSARSALWFYASHLAYGLVTTGLIELLDTDDESHAGMKQRGGDIAQSLRWWRVASEPVGHHISPEVHNTNGHMWREMH